MKGRDALKITWEDGPNASYSSDTYRAALEESARRGCAEERPHAHAARRLTA